jgi:hypothetical protein
MKYKVVTISLICLIVIIFPLLTRATSSGPSPDSDTGGPTLTSSSVYTGMYTSSDEDEDSSSDSKSSSSSISTNESKYTSKISEMQDNSASTARVSFIDSLQYFLGTVCVAISLFILGFYLVNKLTNGLLAMLLSRIKFFRSRVLNLSWKKAFIRCVIFGVVGVGLATGLVKELITLIYTEIVELILPYIPEINNL